ncbi:MAG: hypothetical protein GMKNLPBB_02149 [Myxococcota bacterium]|nr:hypothetical protein [Myxococcota bacterium]
MKLLFSKQIVSLLAACGLILSLAGLAASCGDPDVLDDINERDASSRSTKPGDPADEDAGETDVGETDAEQPETGGGDNEPAESGPCPDKQELRCGKCVPTRCKADTDCNPGSVCRRDGTCVFGVTVCADDTACEPGQICAEGIGGAKGCTRKACSGPADCTDGTACFAGYCLRGLPCAADKGCEGKGACLVDQSRCIDTRDACKDACPAGQVKVIKDPAKTLTAECPKLECECLALPPLPTGDIGLWSDSAVLPDGSVIASSYNQLYGDLLVVKFAGPGLAKAADAVFVDGFPANGVLAGDPKGPRKGVSEAGDNVGEYSSIAVDKNGGVHIAYYDRTNGDLKYARGSGDTWSVHAVDSEGDTGVMPDITIGPDGFPRIAYFMAKSADGKATAVKFATASKADPSGSADWQIQPIEEGPWTEIKKPNGYYDGVGLYPSLVFHPSGNPVVCYYDNTTKDAAKNIGAGNLKIARSDGSNWIVTLLDGQDAKGADTGDVGAWCSVAVNDKGEILVAYEDLTREDLKFINVTANKSVVVDNGSNPGLNALAGADTSMAFDGGKIVIVYQDASKNDLVMATSNDGATWGKKIIRDQGAWGYFNRVNLKDGKAWITSTRLTYKDVDTFVNEFELISETP